jgi:hypothetical protein
MGITNVVEVFIHLEVGVLEWFHLIDVALQLTICQRFHFFLVRN